VPFQNAQQLCRIARAPFPPYRSLDTPTLQLGIAGFFSKFERFAVFFQCAGWIAFQSVDVAHVLVTRAIRPVSCAFLQAQGFLIKLFGFTVIPRP